jgi:hypothetical protein
MSRIFTTEEATVRLFYPERLISVAVTENLSLFLTIRNWTQEMEYDKLNRGKTSMFFQVEFSDSGWYEELTRR